MRESHRVRIGLSRLLITIAAAALTLAPLGCSSDHDRDHDHDHEHTSGQSNGALPVTVTSDSGQLSVNFSSPHPLERGENELLLEIHDHETQEVRDDLTLEVEPYMPAHHHGSSAVPIVTSQGQGRYQVTNVVFTMAGDWELRVRVTAPFEDAFRTTVTIP